MREIVTSILRLPYDGMKEKMMAKVVMATIVIIISMMLSLVGVNAATDNTIMDLGTLTGGRTSWAADINNKSQVVGASQTANGNYHAVLWQEGAVVDLGALVGGAESTAYAISNSGLIVGSSNTKTNTEHAVFWQNNRAVDLGVLPGGTNSCAYGINDLGQIIGIADLPDGTQHAVFWQKGIVTDLGTLPGGDNSCALAINNNGIIVGWSENAVGNQHAVAWQDGAIVDLGTLQSNCNSWATAISDSGLIAGSCDTPTGTTQAVSWQQDGIVNLATQEGANSWATGVDAYGHIAGWSENSAAVSAAICWKEAPVNLQTLGGIKSSAMTMNDNGQLAGYSYIANGNYHAAVWQISPEISISEPSSASTLRGPVSYTISYLWARQIVLTPAHITINSTGTATGRVSVIKISTNTRKITISNITGAGTLGIAVAGGTATNTGGSAPAMLASTPFAVASAPPTITIGNPIPTLTTGGVIRFVVRYSGARSITLSLAGISLNQTGTATGTVSVIGTSLIARTVVISNVTGNGTLGISIAPGTSSNQFGSDTGAGPSAVATVINAPPEILISEPSVSSTVNGPVSFTVLFSGATRVNLTTAGIILNRIGTANGQISVSGTGTTSRIVTISNITGTGTLGISILRGSATNPRGIAPAAGPSNVVAILPAVPIVTIGAPSVTTTTTGPVNFIVTFAGATNVALSPADIILNSTGTATGTISVSPIGNNTFVVTISNINGSGTLGISIIPGTSSNQFGSDLGAGPSATVAVSAATPRISISAPSVTSTTTGPVSFTITFQGADNITLAPADVILNRTGTATGNISVTGTGTATRIVTISNITGNGTLGISLAPGTASNAFGAAAGVGPSMVFSVGLSVPVVTIGAPSVTNTTTGPVDFIVTYTGATNIALSPADIILNSTGTATGTVSVNGAGNNIFVVTISNITGNGTLGISIVPGTSSNQFGNDFGAGPSATVAVGVAVPVISISAPSVSTTTTGPVSYIVTYSNADVITLSPADIMLVSTGTATGQVSIFDSGTNFRTVTISNITGNGTLAISILPGTASNQFGFAPAAGPSAPVTVSGGVPIIAISAPSTSSTVNGPVSYTITYSGANNITLAPANVILNSSGTAAGNVSVTGTGNTTRIVTIFNITGSGTLGISLAPGTASNAFGVAAGAGPSTVFSVGPFVPSITITGPSVSTTATGPVSYVVTYSNATVVLLSASNITLNQTGTAAGTVTVSGTGTTNRVITISNITGNGTLGINIAPGTALNNFGLAPAAGPSTTFTVSNPPPSITISAPSLTSTTSGPVTYILTYSGANAISLLVSDITLNTSGTATGRVTVSGTGTTTRLVTISNITGNGTIGISVAPGTASNRFGTALGAGPSALFTVTNGPPTISLSGPSVTSTNTGPVSYTVTYTNATSVVLTSGNIRLLTSGTAFGTVNVTGTGTTTRTVTISNIFGNGNLAISISAGSAFNQFGPAPASGPSVAVFVTNP
jgi:probable HAF family extracellular repeat protein